jgi:hypothetical protein
VCRCLVSPGRSASASALLSPLSPSWLPTRGASSSAASSRMGAVTAGAAGPPRGGARRRSASGCGGLGPRRARRAGRREARRYKKCLQFLIYSAEPYSMWRPVPPLRIWRGSAGLQGRRGRRRVDLRRERGQDAPGGREWRRADSAGACTPGPMRRFGSGSPRPPHIHCHCRQSVCPPARPL